MHDTSPEIEEKMREMFRAKSPMERFKMGCSMYDTVKWLAIRAIKEKNPNISPAALRQELFLRFYRDDFTSEQCERIVAYLGKTD